MKHLLQLRKVLRDRQAQQVSDLLAAIEQHGLLGSNPHGPIAQLFSKEVKVDGLRDGAFLLLLSLSLSLPPSVTLFLSFSLFLLFFLSQVAKVMLQLLRLQEQLVQDLVRAVQEQDAVQLNRLLLRSEKLDMHSHPSEQPPSLSLPVSLSLFTPLVRHYY